MSAPSHAHMVKVGRHVFPTPLETTVLKGTSYYFVQSENCSWFEVGNDIWSDSNSDVKRLSRRICHLSREACQAQADALNAVCRGDVE